MLIAVRLATAPKGGAFNRSFIMRRTSVTAAALGAIALGLVSTAAVASPVTFGSFTPKTKGMYLSYTNEDVVTKARERTAITPKAELVTVTKVGRGTANPLVSFTALADGKIGSGVATGDMLASDFLFGAVSNSAVIDNGGGYYTQLFDGSFSFIKAGTKINILTAMFTGAQLSAKKGTSSLTLDGSSAGGTLVYTSDLFAVGLTNDFSLGATGLSAKISYLPGQSFAAKSGFTGTATGNFSTVVPEPSAVALLGLGLGALGLIVRRRNVAAA